jgi:hypothetical protein
VTVRERLDLWLEANDEGVLLADGFDEALVGIARIFNTLVAIYDRELCLVILQRDMPYAEAEEFFEFNTQGAYVGEQTPGFLVWRADDEEDAQ